jgi:hypothetical protein
MLDKVLSFSPGISHVSLTSYAELEQTPRIGIHFWLEDCLVLSFYALFSLSFPIVKDVIPSI